jgi:hypothetical protein
MSVLVDRKSERAIQAKIKDMQKKEEKKNAKKKKNIFPVD